MIVGLLQKVAMTSMPDLMAEQGSKYLDRFAGGLTREQHDRLDESLRYLRERQESGAAAADSGNDGIIAVTARAVVGENKNNPMVSFYAVGTPLGIHLGPPGAHTPLKEMAAFARVRRARNRRRVV
jgi:hypothetical protein